MENYIERRLAELEQMERIERLTAMPDIRWTLTGRAEELTCLVFTLGTSGALEQDAYNDYLSRLSSVQSRLEAWVSVPDGKPVSFADLLS